MVYIPPPHLAAGRQSYAHAYNRILTTHRRSHQTSASSVVILVAPDVDALCAVRMLTTLFKQDDVNYRIIPVSGLMAFHAIKDDLKLQSDLHTLILINMGIRYDLPTADWFGDLDPKVTIHVLDSARPQSLVNLFMGGESGERILVWDDGDADKMEEEKKSWEVIEYEPRPDSEDEDEDDLLSEEEDEGPEDAEDYGVDGDSENGSPTKRKAVTKQSARKRIRTEKENRISVEEYQRHEQRLEKYYSTGTSYGQGAANTIYVLATLLERTDIDTLWLAIIGLTFQYTTSRISRTTYEKYQGLYADEVSRLNPLPAEAQSSSIAMNSDDFYIRSTNELRFTLYRHWTVYDAMFHSSYVASKLGLWKEKGRQRLTGLLAKMGFSIPQTQQPFHHMDKDLKHLLQDKLDEIAPEYGLEELNYPSFARCFGYHTQALSAADAVEGINALLDVAEGIRMEIEVEGSRNGGEWFGAGRVWDVSTLAVKPKKATPSILSATSRPKSTTAPDEEKDGEDEKNPMWWRNNFWAAYDSLLVIGSLRKSLNLAMSLHRAVIRQGTSVIDKQDIKTMRNHRVVVLSQGPDLNLFCHPGVLSRLALWLVDALRERVAATSIAGSRSKKKGLPIVVACLNEETEQYVVVGVMASINYGQVLKNEFALTFINATRVIGAELHMESFDTTIVEVKKHELKAFLTALCT